MKEYTGWLFDLYAHPKGGVVVWLLGEDKKPHVFHHRFQVAFYVGGPVHRRRQLWTFLKDKPVTRSPVQRRDLYSGLQDVLEIKVEPCAFAECFKQVHERFPDLLYYDADIPLILRYSAEHNLFPLAHCKLKIKRALHVAKITPLDTPWELDPALPDLRVLYLRPNVNPARAAPEVLSVNFGPFKYRLPLRDSRGLLSRLNAILQGYDPDVILTSYGDTWLFNYLEELSQETRIPFNPNRDPAQSVHKKKEISFHNYGRAHYRGEQVHLFGRWHIDDQNCMTFGDYGLLGAIEQARVTGLPVQEMARRSPGAGVAAMQNLAALRRGVLVPYAAQKGEAPKTYDQLVVADRGGIIFEPLLGIFPHVAIIDFVSMYPSAIVGYNISPETVCVQEEDAWEIPELGLKVSSREGLIPAALRPMVQKRVKIRRLLKNMPKDDPRYQRYKAGADGLKWLGVVSNGRLGFANAVFGRINAHETLSFVTRQAVLRAKEIVENHGFTVLHIYVDSLFLCKPGATRAGDFQFLLDEIQRETRLPIEVEAVYPWMAFLPSVQNPGLSVANRFFAMHAEGDHKIRGLALRREDTPLFIADTQLEVLQILMQESDPTQLVQLLPEVLVLLRERFSALNNGTIPLRELLVTQTLSRELDEYHLPSPAARAARQLASIGKNIRMGQRIQFIYVKTKSGVHAWDLPEPINPSWVDIPKYKALLFRAIHEVIQPLGVSRAVLKNWLFGGAGYLLPPGLLHPNLGLPLFANLKHLRLGAP